MALVEVYIRIQVPSRRREVRPPSLRIVRDDEPRFPKTRGECVDGPRPCPWARCRHHLHVDLTTANPPSLLVNENREDTCSLDVADRAGPNGMTTEEVATVMRFTRARAQQIEAKALKHAARIARRMGLETFHPGNE